jgi:hypothetical protein
MKDANSEFAIIIKEKEEIFRKMAFPDSIISSINISISRDSSINAISSFIIEENIEKTLFEQSIKNVRNIQVSNIFVYVYIINI